MSTLLRSLIASLIFLIGWSPLLAEGKKVKTVAGKADVLKHVRKRFAQFLSYDESHSSVRLRIEGDEEDTTWPMLADAEIKIHGWWGRPGQLRTKKRVWVWWMIDREKKPKAILMLADEMSEQDIHHQPLEITALAEREVTVHVPDEKKIPARKLRLADNYDGPRKIGAKVIVQSEGNILHQAVRPEDFEELRSKQQEWLRQVWRKEGLPGRVSFLHPISGEMDIILDHEAIRWGRYLKLGDKVTIRTKRAVTAVVKTVQPWRERTQIRLVTNSGLDQLDYILGERIDLLVPEPPKEIQSSTLPPDLGRLKEKEERVQWFLSTIYCSCGIQGDKCTGMFYIQASCNVNGCGMPNIMAGDIREMIDQGLPDQKIYAKLVTEKGRDLWRPHLLR